MSIIYSYPIKGAAVDDDLILISDSASTPKFATKQVRVSGLPFSNNQGTVTSVGVSMPSAFAVASSPITDSGTIAVTTTGGNVGQFLAHDGTWGTPTGGAANPAGSNSEIQYNNGGAFGASPDFSYASNILRVKHTISVLGQGNLLPAGRLKLNCEQNSHAITLEGPAHSGGADYTLKFPSAAPGNNQILEYTTSGNLGWIATPSGGGSSLAILNEGTDITAAATSINFVGSGVTATAATNAVTVTIPDAFVIEDVQYSVAVAKGDALYISGPAHGSGRPTVGIADATAQQAGNEKYPVVGLAIADYSPGEGKMIVTGILDDFNTASITNPVIGQPVYVGNSGSTGDTLTGIKPTGTDVIQNVAIINKTGANGSLQVSCIGRTNDLPNLEQGKIWLGDATGVPSALTIGNSSAVLTSNGTTASWSPLPNTSLVTGVTGTLPVGSGGTGITTAVAGTITRGNGTNGFTADTDLQYDGTQKSLKIRGTGNTAPTMSAPLSINDIQGSSSIYEACIGLTPYKAAQGGKAISIGLDGYRDGIIVVRKNAASGAAMIFHQVVNANAQVGSITMTNSATAYNTTSDYRSKENVVEMTGSVDRVKQLKPSRFNFISEPDSNVVDGFLAHEVSSIVPEAIHGEKDAVDDQGNPIYQGIDQSKLVPLLVGAIKELTARIEALEA